MIGIVAAAVFFGCVAFVGVEASRAVCARIVPLDDGPPLSQPPRSALIAASAMLGAISIVRGAQPLEIAVLAIVVLALVACWCSDAQCGIVPDAFTLGPLAAIVVLCLARADWSIVLGVVIPFVPFAAVAIVSHGKGIGWGDVKLAALAGAALGAPLAILAMGAACVAVVVGYRIKRISSGPIAFAPYIAAAIGIALPLGIGR